ncbi:hypothetical protein D3C76_1564230 [compost metagenome]
MTRWPWYRLTDTGVTQGRRGEVRHARTIGVVLATLVFVLQVGNDIAAGDQVIHGHGGELVEKLSPYRRMSSG